jgi:hypothetical protein
MGIGLERSSRSYGLTVIAATGDGPFVDFRPFVAAIADDGRVVFQAQLARGGSGVFHGAGLETSPVLESGDGGVRDVISHPDVDARGAVCCYVRLDQGTAAIVRAIDGSIARLGEPDAFAEVGPLGPTINRSGAVAFRARDRRGRHGVFLGSGGHLEPIAVVGARFAGFDGLPIVTDDERVVFRATRTDGSEGIYMWRDSALSTVVETGARFTGLGRFPVANDAAIVFQASGADGGSGIYAWIEGAVATIIDSSGEFSSFRGANLDEHGGAVFYATPRGGQLGIYTGPDPVRDRVLGIGDPFGGSRVEAFVLNPVSINATGQLAIRIELTDGRQLIARAR